MKRITILLITLMVMALVVVGCGRRSGSAPKTSSTSSSTSGTAKSSESTAPTRSEQPASSNVPAVSVPGVAAMPTNPSASDVMTRVAARYKAMKTLDMSLAMQRKQTINGKSTTNNGDLSLSMQFERPNKIRLTTTSGKASEVAVSNGKEMVQYSSAQNVYQKGPMPKNFLNSNNKEISTFSLLSGADISPIAKKAKLVKTEKLDGVDCYLIELVVDRSPGGSSYTQRAWFGKDDLLVRKIESTRIMSVKDQNKSLDEMLKQAEAKMKAAGQKPGTRPNIPRAKSPATMVDITEIHSIKADGSIPESTFRFTPPKSAKTAADMQKQMQEQFKKRMEEQMKKGNNTGKKAPDFTLPDTNGKDVSLSSFKGKPVLVFFWSLSSPASKKALPNVAKLADDIKGNGAVVLGVNLDANNPEVAKTAKDSNVNFPILVGAQKAFVTANDYGVMQLPVIYVIGPDGVVKGKILGPESPDEMKSELAKYGVK